MFEVFRRHAQPAPSAVHRAQTTVAEALLRTTALLLDSTASPEQHIRRLCESLLQAEPHLRLAWTWFGPSETRLIRPQVAVGPARAYALELSIARSFLTELGPAFRALRGQPADVFSVSTHSLFAPWRRAAREHGIESVLALPLASHHDRQHGLFVLYADERDYFEKMGMGLFDALAQMLSSLLSQAVLKVQLADQALKDALTGLMNRRAITAMHAALAPEERRRPASLLLLDLDHFKRTNDDHGHAFGDAVLQTVATLLQETTRRSDHVARWGGEEFLVWLPDTPLEVARGVAEKIRSRAAEMPTFTPQGEPVYVTLSIGVAAREPGDTLDDIVGRADDCLYAAKRAGRDRVVAGGPAASGGIVAVAPPSTF